MARTPREVSGLEGVGCWPQSCRGCAIFAGPLPGPDNLPVKQPEGRSVQGRCADQGGIRSTVAWRSANLQGSMQRDIEGCSRAPACRPKGTFPGGFGLEVTYREVQINTLEAFILVARGGRSIPRRRACNLDPDVRAFLSAAPRHVRHSRSRGGSQGLRGTAHVP
jgi:hypothetical protein